MKNIHFHYKFGLKQFKQVLLQIYDFGVRYIPAPKFSLIEDSLYPFKYDPIEF